MLVVHSTPKDSNIIFYCECGGCHFTEDYNIYHCNNCRNEYMFYRYEDIWVRRFNIGTGEHTLNYEQYIKYSDLI